MQTTWPPRFLFIGGCLALDFVQTGGAGERARWECWFRPEDLADWIAAAPYFGFRPELSGRELAAAKLLREAIWNFSQAMLAGQSPDANDVNSLERFAAEPDLVPIWQDGRRAWSQSHMASSILSSVARDAFALFGTDLVARFRKCANPHCALMFVDRSRAGKRTWCAMERCGNLHKAALHRARKKGDHHAD